MWKRSGRSTKCGTAGFWSPHSARGIAVGLLRQDLDTRDQVELSVAGAASFGFLGYPIARLAAHFIPGSILYRHSGSAHRMPLPQAPAQSRIEMIAINSIPSPL